MCSSIKVYAEMKGSSKYSVMNEIIGLKWSYYNSELPYLPEVVV
jgi:hypothetical protein